MMISPGAARAISRGQDSGHAPAGASLSADALIGAVGIPESDLRVFGRKSEAGDAAQQLGVALATAPDVSTARDRARDVAAALSRGPAAMRSQTPS
jgi:phosphoribosylglycinamide formyltransferase 2